jgi:hypothetical protein
MGGVRRHGRYEEVEEERGGGEFRKENAEMPKC